MSQTLYVGNPNYLGDQTYLGYSLTGTEFFKTITFSLVLTENFSKSRLFSRILSSSLVLLTPHFKKSLSKTYKSSLPLNFSTPRIKMSRVVKSFLVLTLRTPSRMISLVRRSSLLFRESATKKLPKRFQSNWTLSQSTFLTRASTKKFSLVLSPQIKKKFGRIHQSLLVLTPHKKKVVLGDKKRFSLVLTSHESKLPRVKRKFSLVLSPRPEKRLLHTKRVYILPLSFHKNLGFKKRFSSSLVLHLHAKLGPIDRVRTFVYSISLSQDLTKVVTGLIKQFSMAFSYKKRMFVKGDGYSVSPDHELLIEDAFDFSVPDDFIEPIRRDLTLTFFYTYGLEVSMVES